MKFQNKTEEKFSVRKMQENYDQIIEILLNN